MSTIKEIPLKDLVGNTYNPRKRFDTAAMTELEGSIKNQGLVQAILVRPIDNGKFEVVAGMRRFMAATQAEIETVPCLIRELDDQEAKLASLTENLERSNLSPMEEARSFADILNWDGQSHFEGKRQDSLLSLLINLAENIPMDKSTVKFRLTLLHLPEKAQTKVDQGTLAIKKAEEIVRLRKLWKTKIVGLSDEEIKEKRDQIKQDIHERMMKIVESPLGTVEEIRVRVNKILKTAEENVSRAKEVLSNLGKKRKAASEVLTTYSGDLIEKYKKKVTSWKKELTEQEKIDLLMVFFKTQLKGTELDEITLQRTALQTRYDMLSSNLAFVKENVLEVCPYCSAGIAVKAMQRKIDKLNEQISTEYTKEAAIGKERKAYRSEQTKLKKLLTTYVNEDKVFKEQRKAMGVGGN